MTQTKELQAQMSFDQGTDKVTKTENKQENKQEAPVAKKENLPAIPKKLVDAGLATCFLAPKQAFLAAGGSKEQFAREVNFAMQSLMNNDFLLNCAKSNPEFLIEAIKNVALTGLTLNPELRLGYLIPYNKKITFRSSYMGKVDILIRSGIVKWIEANLVYEKDAFSVTKGSKDEIIHAPDCFASDRGDIKGGYWIATMPNGLKVFGVMSKNDIDQIKQRSESAKSGGQTPWNTDYEEMAKKTIINRAFKSLPKSGISDAVLKAMEVDGQYDREEFEDWKKQQENNIRDRFNEDEITEARVVE